MNTNPEKWKDKRNKSRIIFFQFNLIIYFHQLRESESDTGPFHIYSGFNSFLSINK
jgi:hypothetical protein